ncbi:tRNA1(Val) (adenine(37)-N6)-methyltransferase [Longitalea luteola]|uniref:tRNA1(Val) (adenine(37)-N6)-methyltransferase n=1 Tax=Longitalea luteola TaxID=2812563 RepID=UPI001A95B909|nr:methyltransferase [Longitalea luteola]
MPNSYFQFKQFTIHQNQCALKVCTDACILGAWFSAKIPQYATVLDIGSGTGLLMMMLAQRSQAEIHGIEIDLAAYRQAKENISQNAWAMRMKVFPGDARTFHFPLQYEFIISNPPFFEDDLQSTDDREQIAKHSKHLTLEELIQVIADNLQPHGAFGILLPYHRWEYFNTLATRYNFSLTEKLFVKQSPRHNHFRAILHYTRNQDHFAPTFELTIQQADGNYTPEFVELMKDYYLYL